MTTPARGLFERIEPFLESLHPNSAWRRRIKEEIEKFEQRLAEAERAERNRDMWKGQSERQAETIAQLRARCGELERLVAAVVKWFEDGMPDKDDPRANMLRVLNLGAALTVTPQPTQEPYRFENGAEFKPAQEQTTK